MNENIRGRLFLLPALLILISACAKISAPSGGPKDRLPPVVIKSVPDKGTKNFRNKSIVITFNKYVVLDNITEKFMVSPPMKKKPRVFIKGKNVVVELNEKLKDSTTYTFYFQDAIKDLNEGNIIDNYQFVFSTGPVIDSLSVTGNVYKSYNLEVPEKTLVLMYSELTDSAVIKHLPDYISRVDQTGYFRIDNVRAGTYRLYALKDMDNSKNYNLPEEEFAFRDSLIEITPEKNFIPVVKDTTTLIKVPVKVAAPASSSATSTSAPAAAPVPPPLKGEYQLILFAAQKKAHYLTKSSRDIKYHMIYALSLPPDSMKFEFSIPGEGNDKYYVENSRNRDTLKVWLTDSTLYSQPQITTIVNYPFTDTLGVLGYKEDTIQMRYLAPRPPRGAKVKKPAFNVEFNISNSSLKPGQQIVLKAETPFRQPDTTHIRLYELLTTDKIKIPYSLIKDSSNSCRYLLKATFLQGKKYLFVSDSASFGNIYNEHSDSIGIKIAVREPDSYGMLTLNISNYEGNRIIQLLDKTEKLVSEAYMKKDGKLVFPLLESGTYRVRCIYDLNGDGKWTTGDFTSKRQPEPVSYYPGDIELKTDWHAEQDWDVGVKNNKDVKLREKKKTK
jgi:hypothetical protein